MKYNLSSQALLWTLICTLFAAVPGWLVFSPAIMLFCVLALLWRYIAEIKKIKPLPWWLKLVLIILAIFIIQMNFEHLYGRRAGSALLLMMLNLKATELHTRRDARILLSLNLFLASVFFLFQQTLLMQLYSLVLLLLTLYGLNLLLEKQAVTSARRHERSGRALLPANIHALLENARIIIYAIPLTVVLFMVFPRLATPLWGTPEGALDGKTGLSDEMAPGSIQSLFMDDSPAFRVEFNGRRPQQTELYWRGPVLWNFDGRRWTTLPRIYRALSPKQLPAPSPARIDYTVQLEPTERHWLYALDYVVVKPTGSYLTAGYQLFNKLPVTNPKTYQLSSEPVFAKPPGLSLTHRQWSLALPKAYNPKSRTWIKQLQDNLPVGMSSTSAAGQKLMVKKVLDNFSQNDFYYSLNPPPMGRQSVDDFMFNTRTGFCEHYASSFTVLMRMAGIPARVVTGYQGGYYNNRANYLLVRQSDAHAWSEVWLEGIGWQRVDPTSQVAPERILSGAMDAFPGPRNWHDFIWLRNLRNSLDRVQHFWNNSVMGFNADSQLKLLKLSGLDKWPANQVALLLLLPIFLSIGIASYFLLKNNTGRDTNPIKKSYMGYLKFLKEQGLQVHSHNSVSEVAMTVSAALRKTDHEDRQYAIDSVQNLCDKFNQTIYSQSQISLAELQILVKQSIKLTRKVLTATRLKK